MTSQTFFFILLGIVIVGLVLGIRYMARHDYADPGKKRRSDS